MIDMNCGAKTISGRAHDVGPQRSANSFSFFLDNIRSYNHCCTILLAWETEKNRGCPSELTKKLSERIQ